MALRGRPPKQREDWMESVADLMVKEHMSFTSACMAIGRTYKTGAEEMADRYSDAFQNVLDAVTFKFYARIGDNPLLTKGVLAGVLLTAVRRLGESDSWDKIAVPGKLLADMMGWTEHTPEAPVFANLTQTDIEALRAKVAKAEEEARQKPTQIVIVSGEKPN